MKRLERAKITPANKLKAKYYKLNPNEEVWMNDKYQVNVRRNLDGFGEKECLTHLSIKRLDRRALPDWRDFQKIKNQLVGEECEGIELYPAESRLVDGANQYHIWVFQKEGNIPVGFTDGRMISDICLMGETQRKWSEEDKPADLEEQNDFYKKRVEHFINLKEDEQLK